MPLNFIYDAQKPTAVRQLKKFSLKLKEDQAGVEFSITESFPITRKKWGNFETLEAPNKNVRNKN